MVQYPLPCIITISRLGRYSINYAACVSSSEVILSFYGPLLYHCRLVVVNIVQNLCKSTHDYTWAWRLRLKDKLSWTRYWQRWRPSSKLPGHYSSAYSLLSIVSYVTSVGTSNVSQVDRVWTFLPLKHVQYSPRPNASLSTTRWPTPLIPFALSIRTRQLEPHFWTPKAAPIRPHHDLDVPSLTGQVRPQTIKKSRIQYIWSFDACIDLFSLHNEDYRC